VVPLAEKARRTHVALAHYPPALAVNIPFVSCERDLEGIVAKWSKGTYQSDGRATSWLKIKNPAYSQMEGRHELFATKRAGWRSHRPTLAAPTLALLLTTKTPT
jgi:hypothetical protein